MAHKTEHNKKALIQAMQKNLGNVTASCKAVGLGRTTYYEYYNTDEAFKATCDECENIALDFVESKLHEQIDEGVPSSTIFFLKTKGKKRGYIEKQEIEHSGGIQGGFAEAIKKLDN